MNLKRFTKDMFIKDYIYIDGVKFLKIRSFLKNSKLSCNKLFKVFNERKYNKLCYQNNASIPLRAKIGDGLTLPHGLSGIFISIGAEIGDNCTIFQQVTIGSNTLGQSKKCGAPKIGNNVYIGAGAKIIGNVNIGNNVRIGANCVVVDDIPDNATVVLNHPRIIIHKERRDNSFYKFDNHKK